MTSGEGPVELGHDIGDASLLTLTPRFVRMGRGFVIGVGCLVRIISGIYRFCPPFSRVSCMGINELCEGGLVSEFLDVWGRGGCSRGWMFNRRRSSYPLQEASDPNTKRGHSEGSSHSAEPTKRPLLRRRLRNGPGRNFHRLLSPNTLSY